MVWVPPQVLRHQSWGLVSWGVREAARLQEAPKSKRILACRQNPFYFVQPASVAFAKHIKWGKNIGPGYFPLGVLDVDVALRLVVVKQTLKLVFFRKVTAKYM